MTTITITDDNGNTATAETLGKAKRALARAEKANAEARKARFESEDRARDDAYCNLGILAKHAGPDSWGSRAEVYESGTRGYAIYTSDSTAVCMRRGNTIRLASIAWKNITAIYVSPVGHAMALRLTHPDLNTWMAIGADGDNFDSVEIPAAIAALFPAPTADEPAPAAPDPTATEGR